MYLTTKPHEVKVTGIDFVAENLIGSTTFNHDSVTEDSHFMLFNGDLPIGLQLNLGASADWIKGTAFNVHGNEGVARSANRLATTEIWSQGFADGADAFNLLGYLQAETTNAPTQIGANGTSYHLGVHIGGDNTKPTASPNNWGELIWNPKGQNQGSFAMCGGGAGGVEEACGVIQTSSGPVLMPYQVNIKNGGMLNGNGLIVGAQQPGHAAALGIYQDAQNSANLFEIMEGTTQLLFMNAAGSMFLNGDLTAKGQIVAGKNITMKAGKSLVGIPASGSGFPVLTASSGTEWKLSTSAGRDASLTGFIT